MTVETKYYKGEPGNTIINDSNLIGSQIVRVSREGVGFNSIEPDFSPAPTLEPIAGNREFKFYPGIGRIEFLEPFLGDEAALTRGSFEGAETIMIKFRT